MVARDLVSLQSSLRLNLGLGVGCLRLRMCLSCSCSLVSGFGRHDGSMLHDLDVVLVSLIVEFFVRIFAIILEAISLQRIQLHSTRRNNISTINQQTTATPNTSPK